MMQRRSAIPFARSLLVGVVAPGVTAEVDISALLNSLPHRRRTGVVVDARPFFLFSSSPWFALAQENGLALRVSTPEPDEDPRELSSLELHLSLLRRLRDRRVDVVLVVGLTTAPAPLVREIHDGGRFAILAVSAEHVDRALRCADAVIPLDEITHRRAA